MLKEKPVGSYVLAVQTPIYRLSEQSFAVESAFSHHLKQLREQFAGRISKFVIIAPEMSEESYRSSPSLTIIGAESGIDVLPAYPADVSVTAFWTKHAGRIWREVTARVGDASVVHSGLASDLWRPLVALVNLVVKPRSGSARWASGALKATSPTGSFTTRSAGFRYGSRSASQSSCSSRALAWSGTSAPEGRM